MLPLQGSPQASRSEAWRSNLDGTRRCRERQRGVQKPPAACQGKTVPGAVLLVAAGRSVPGGPPRKIPEADGGVLPSRWIMGGRQWSEFVATLPPFSPIEGQKCLTRFPANESPRRTGLHWYISAKSGFYLPAFEISRSCPPPLVVLDADTEFRLFFLLPPIPYSVRN